jgi:glycine cleavage system H protein
MSTLKFTDDHEWLRAEDDGTVTVGITHYAQDQLGDLIYVQLPEVGRKHAPGEEVVVLESVKAAADIKMPIGGTVIEVNESVVKDPALVNRDPLGDGWFFRTRIDDAGALAGLMDEPAYQKLVGSLG